MYTYNNTPFDTMDIIIAILVRNDSFPKFGCFKNQFWCLFDISFFQSKFVCAALKWNEKYNFHILCIFFCLSQDFFDKCVYNWNEHRKHTP